MHDLARSTQIYSIFIITSLHLLGMSLKCQSASFRLKKKDKDFNPKTLNRPTTQCQAKHFTSHFNWDDDDYNTEQHQLHYTAGLLKEYIKMFYFSFTVYYVILQKHLNIHHPVEFLPFPQFLTAQLVLLLCLLYSS